jgi:hypothetical protein
MIKSDLRFAARDNVRDASTTVKRSDAHGAPDGASLSLWRLLCAVGPRLRSVGVGGLVVLLVLPLLGFSVPEADPYHEHILVGGTSPEQLSALTYHLYHHLASPWPPTRHPESAGRDPAAVTGGPCVVSVLNSTAVGTAVLALGSAGLVGAGRCIAPDPTLAGRVVMTPFAFWWEVILLTPDPPPRWS